MSPTTEKSKQVATSTLLMGMSATGKSALLATLAEYVWETHHKVSYYYVTDGGGFPTRMQSLIDLGIVRFWRLRTRSASGLVFETLHRACSGWWPSRIHARTGETDPAVRLVPPMTVTFQVTCPQGHVMFAAPTPPMMVVRVCPTCKQPQSPDKQVVTKSTTPTKGFEERGACLYDGLTSMAPMMLNDLAARAGRLELQGEKAGIGGIVGSGDLSWTGNNRAQVGFAQSRMEELVNASLGIPGLVVPPVFTALTQEATDSGGLTVKGPELAGQAKTATAPQWFGNVLETALVKNSDGEDCHALFLEGFIDGQGAKHPLRTRAKPGSLPASLVDPSLAMIRKDPTLAFSVCNLGGFFRMLDAALEAEKQEMSAKYTNAPGTPELMEFGGGSGEGTSPIQQTTTQTTGGGGGAAPVAQTPPTAATATAPTAPAVIKPRGRGRAVTQTAPELASTVAAPTPGAGEAQGPELAPTPTPTQPLPTQPLPTPIEVSPVVEAPAAPVVEATHEPVQEQASVQAPTQAPAEAPVVAQAAPRPAPSPIPPPTQGPRPSGPIPSGRLAGPIPAATRPGMTPPAGPPRVGRPPMLPPKA